MLIWIIIVGILTVASSAATIPSGLEKTEVLYGKEYAVARGEQFMSRTKRHMDLCYDKRAPSIVVEVEQYRKGYADLRRRGGTIRVITEITNDNLQYCKELSNLTDEIRHLDKIKGGMAVSDSEYMATNTLQEAAPLTQVVFSNVRELVEQQQYVFETLWSRAIPARERIREIEEGIKPDVVEIVREPAETLRMYIDLISSATKEILLVFPSANAFSRHSRVGVLKALKEAASRNVKIKILSPASTDHAIERTIQEMPDSFVVRNFRHASGGIKASTILVVDRSESMAIEVKEDTAKTFSEAIGFSTYSNSEPTVVSYTSIFESFWLQSA